MSWQPEPSESICRPPIRPTFEWQLRKSKPLDERLFLGGEKRIWQNCHQHIPITIDEKDVIGLVESLLEFDTGTVFDLSHCGID